VLDGLFLQFRDEVDGGLVLVLVKMTINAVKAGVQLATLEPLPAWSVAGVEYFIPILVPGEKFSEFCVVIGKVVEAEALENRRVGQVCLADEFRRWMDIPFLLPMYRNLSFRSFNNLLLFTHRSASCSVI